MRTSIIGDLDDGRGGEIARRGTGGGLTNGSQPRYTDGINLHSCLQPRRRKTKTSVGAHMTKHPGGKESMNTSNDVSPGDTRRKKKRKERTRTWKGD